MSVKIPLEQLKNPLDMRFFTMIVTIGTIFFLMGVIDYFLLNGKPHTFILMSIVSGTGYILIIYRELIHKPSVLCIDINGIWLYFRFNSSKHLPWGDILWIDAKSGNLSTVMGRWERIGMLQPVKGNPYPLSYEIAASIKESFLEKMGRYPMTKEEYHLKTGRPS